LDARSDDELMLAAAPGDRSAYESLVRRHQRSVRAFCARWCGSASAGDDVAQECFVELWQRRASYTSRGRFRAYLLHIAANRCKNYLRARARERLVSDHDATEAVHGGEGRISDSYVAQRGDRLQEALDKLPRLQREAVLLRYGAELSYLEVADALGVVEATARSRVFLGLMKLRRLLRVEERK
jgi:RNA polymerase sigma-70 factor (ECF subfamily)